MIGLDELAVSLRSTALPPVEQWQPALCGDIDIRICADGRWQHEGADFQRRDLQILLAGLLRREGDEYFLVTPGEKMRIQVEDQAFVISLVHQQDGRIELLTNCGERLVLGAGHPLQFSAVNGDQIALVEVRAGLFARFSRSAWYALVALAEENAAGDWCICSDGVCWELPLE